ncbi:hypothetical protein M8J76_000626 [Diaphorina citri]|nr:hypothetical protein M8J75_002133 [Diaphorina citri]KAI5726314.1 hypothetical protein M8J76_000626 [Diaphorina citri]KAI5731533.1 hypothetical protein M8J77_011750 [Diaphorina citri]
MSEDKTPVVRLCHILKWTDFDGYGFNLHGEKGKTGQYIGKVDEGSPAEAAGLKEGDHIIEVNSVNICNENHNQVVQRIKAVPDETKLLVVDVASEEYFKSNNITISSSLPDIVHLRTPATSGNSNHVEKPSSEESNNSTNQSLTNNTPTPTTNTNNTTNHENQNNLNLNMSAKELRAKLASRKKYDPKKDYLDIKKKYDIVQKL